MLRRRGAAVARGVLIKAVAWPQVETTIWAEGSPWQADNIVTPGVAEEEVAWAV
jgi:hypothetical protein